MVSTYPSLDLTGTGTGTGPGPEPEPVPVPVPEPEPVPVPVPDRYRYRNRNVIDVIACFAGLDYMSRSPVSLCFSCARVAATAPCQRCACALACVSLMAIAIVSLDISDAKFAVREATAQSEIMRVHLHDSGSGTHASTMHATTHDSVGLQRHRHELVRKDWLHNGTNARRPTSVVLRNSSAETSTLISSFAGLNNYTHGRGREKARARRAHIRSRRAGADPEEATGIMRLKAVRAFLDEFAAMEQKLGRQEAALDTLARPTTLVQTRKYSGRLQTGCVGGCFR